MQRIFEGLEKWRVVIGVVLSVALLGIGVLLAWIDWHPPKAEVVTTHKTTTVSAPQPTAQLVSESTALTSSAKTSNGLVNINTASLTEFDSLPGIGKTYAQRIIDYRQAHGRFKQVHDVVLVKGIGEATYQKIKDKVTAGGE